MSKRAAKNLLIISMIILIVGTIFFFQRRDIFSADYDLGEKISDKEVLVNVDGTERKFSIRTYQKNNEVADYLFESNLTKTRRVRLSGFETDVSLCSVPAVKLNNVWAICLEGEVGAHAKNIQIIKNDFKPANFINGESSDPSVVTDVPDYRFDDSNNDGAIDISLDYRDYDKNPLQDIRRKYFTSQNDEFVFENEE